MQIVLKLRKAFDAVLDLIYPRNCIGCGMGVEAGDFRYLCERCLRDLNLIRSPHCDVCGIPFFGIVETQKACPDCIGLDPDFQHGRSIFLLEGFGRQIVHDFKYRKGQYLLRDIASIARNNPLVIEFIKDSTLIPVPLHPRKHRERGYNQSLLLAELFAREAGGLAVVEALVRIKDTVTQTNLKLRERRLNMKNAFSLADNIKLDPEKIYVVVDDVFTTGSTLEACCTALHRAGARKLNILTLAHA